jgi:hypothetical protein
MTLSFLDSILLISFLISLSVFIQKPVPLFLKLYPFYYLIMLATELRGEYLAHHGKYNTTLYNISSIFEFWFFYFVLREIIKSQKIKKIIFFVMIFYPALSAINLIFLQKEPVFNSINFMTGCLLTVSFCIYYYIELFQETEATPLARLPSFWIVSALFFNNVSVFPMFALISYMNHLPDLIGRNLNSILSIVSVMTSILTSIGFLCRIRIRKSTL